MPRVLGEDVLADGLTVGEHSHLGRQVPGGDHQVSEAQTQPAILASRPEELMAPANSVDMHAETEKVVSS